MLQKHQENKLKCSSSFQAYPSVILTNILLAKASHIAKSRFKEWKNRLNFFMGVTTEYYGLVLILPIPHNWTLYNITINVIINNNGHNYFVLSTCQISSILSELPKVSFNYGLSLKSSITWSASFVNPSEDTWIYLPWFKDFITK